ncbi:MAG: hypothetical protein OXF02_02180 [Simkaniaceae bacterium]|nr:hypothetical protein [Simkaniaceae bacterium]
MVKEGVTRTTPKSIAIRMESIDLTPVITHQPVIAPAVAVNHVAQGLLEDRKKNDIFGGTMIGETLVGVGCVMGAVFRAAEPATHMGATVVAVTGVSAGAGALVGLCAIGVICVTGRCYLARLRSTSFRN